MLAKLAHDRGVVDSHEQLAFTIDGETHELRPGRALFIARGQVHRFDNTAGTDAAFLSVATPGVFRPEYFLEIAEMLEASAGGPPDRASMVEIMRRHGLTPATPTAPVTA